MAEGKREVEIKFRIEDEKAFRRRLEAVGAGFGGKYAEENYFCDDSSGSLAAADRILRLRRSVEEPTEGAHALSRHSEARLTYKEPVADPVFKVRQEIEVVVDDLDRMRIVLDHLGFPCRLGYQKQRELWWVGQVLVTVDRLDFGLFTELEGPAAEIRQVAGRLGFDMRDGIAESYLTLLAKAGG